MLIWIALRKIHLRSEQNFLSIQFKRENKMKILSTLLMLAFAVSLSACNTVEGAGKDIQKGGEKIEQKADEHK